MKSYCVLTEKPETEETMIIMRRVNGRGCCANWGGLRAFYLVKTTPGSCRAEVLAESPTFWGKPTKKAKEWAYEKTGECLV